ncbi:hypothetical protein NQZ68_017995 [Dissostichus eleginoides]|nr:hypothetical protein NQZ68_017995 [Dissostichus eleginoides]
MVPRVMFWPFPHLLKSSNLRDHQRVHNQRVHNQRVHNQSPQPESRRRLWLIVVIRTLILFVVSMACIVLIRYKRIINAAMQMESSSEEQTIKTNISPSESEHEVRLSNIRFKSQKRAE